MPARLRYLRDLVLNSYWFVPALMSAGAVLLSLLTLRLDTGLEREAIRELGTLSGWVYTGGVDGAREVLSTIAGSMITIAGVVFSITIVALTLASSQFGPRVLGNFVRDRGNQIVLGTFVATFLYSLLVLRTIRSEDDDLSAVVPHLSVTTGLVLALVSIGVLIYFIHHVATAIQAPNLIAGIAGELHRAIAGFAVAEPAEPPPGSLPLLAPEVFDREAATIAAPGSGYLEAVDLAGLVGVARERRMVLRLEHRPGQFVSRGGALVRAWPASELDGELEDTVRGAVVIGARRTAIQDMEFMVHQLVEIAVRALSPGINDPFTAITCIDRLGAALSDLVEREIPSAYRLDDAGELRLVIRRPLTFPGIVDACFHQIRQNAAHHAAVHLRLLEVLAGVVERARTAEQVEAFERHAGLVLQAAERAVPARQDLEEIGGRFAAVEAAARRWRGRREAAP